MSDLRHTGVNIDLAPTNTHAERRLAHQNITRRAQREGWDQPWLNMILSILDLTDAT